MEKYFLEKRKLKLDELMQKENSKWSKIKFCKIHYWFGKRPVQVGDWVKISASCYFKNSQTCKEIWGEVKEKRNLHISNFPTLWYNLLEKAIMLLYVAFPNLIIRLKSKIRLKFIRDN